MCKRHENQIKEPLSIEEKIFRTADGASHILMNNFMFEVFNEYTIADGYWAGCTRMLEKLDFDFHHKIAFDFIRYETKHNYDTYKLIYMNELNTSSIYAART